MLNPRAVALQGLGFSPLLVGLQGLIEGGAVVTAAVRRPKRHIKIEQGIIPPTLSQLRQEDELVTDLIVTLVTKGFFDGQG